jgi:hypothetical protein
MSTKMAVFWVVALMNDRPDNGGSKDLWNVGKLLPDYTALQPRRQQSSYSPPWEPQILLNELEFVYFSAPLYCVAQPFYTRDTINIVEESWQHTNPILHIVGRGEMVYGIDWPRQLLMKRPQPKNILFDVHNYPYLLLCNLF